MLTPRQANIAATAGPKQWHHLISADHADTHPEAASPLLNAALKQQCTTLDSTFIALSGYTGAALILAYRIASHSTADAHSALIACRRTAEELTAINGYTQPPHKDTISAINKILYSNDPLAYAMLLVDIIRTANHITES